MYEDSMETVKYIWIRLGEAKCSGVAAHRYIEIILLIFFLPWFIHHHWIVMFFLDIFNIIVDRYSRYFSGIEIITQSIWRIHSEILTGFFQYLMKRKFRRKLGACYFRMHKRLIWRYWCHQFRVYGGNFRHLLKPLALYIQRGIVIFFYLCLQEYHVDNLLVILKQKRRNICMGERN